MQLLLCMPLSEAKKAKGTTNTTDELDRSTFAGQDHAITVLRLRMTEAPELKPALHHDVDSISCISEETKPGGGNSCDKCQLYPVIVST